MSLSYNSIYLNLKSHIRDYQISRTYVLDVMSILDDTIKEIATDSVTNLDRENELRSINNLKPIKRIHTENLLNTQVYTDMANQDSSNSDTDLSIGRSYQ